MELFFRARMYSEQGHLFIVGGEHSNISLQTSGRGYVNINNQDILFVAEMVSERIIAFHFIKCRHVIIYSPSAKICNLNRAHYRPR